ncbi:hypothetical protein V6N13_147962 [Hibiscus sabdariffa]
MANWRWFDGPVLVGCVCGRNWSFVESLAVRSSCGLSSNRCYTSTHEAQFFGLLDLVANGSSAIHGSQCLWNTILFGESLRAIRIAFAAGRCQIVLERGDRDLRNRTMASMKREAMRSLRAMPKAIHYGKTRRQPKKNPKTRILVVLDG